MRFSKPRRNEVCRAKRAGYLAIGQAKRIPRRHQRPGVGRLMIWARLGAWHSRGHENLHVLVEHALGPVQLLVCKAAPKQGRTGYSPVQQASLRHGKHSSKPRAPSHAGKQWKPMLRLRIRAFSHGTPALAEPSPALLERQGQPGFDRPGRSTQGPGRTASSSKLSGIGLSADPCSRVSVFVQPRCRKQCTRPARAWELRFSIA